MPEPDAPPSGRRRWLWLAALVVLAGAGLATWRVLRRPPPLQYQTAAVAKGPVVARVTATGILSAVVTVQVGSQVSGRIAKLNADYNSAVKKGQLIAEIDPALFEANLAQSKANVLAAEGQLKQAGANVLAAQRTYDRDKPLRASNLIAQADLDIAETTLQGAQASVVAARGQLAQARAQLTQSEVNLAYTKILSPIDGTVISRSVDVGQTVAASLQAPTIFTLAGDLQKMQVDTSVAEADVGKLQPGMEATFVVDAFPDQRFRGTIRQNPQRAADTAERGDLRRGDRRGQPGPQAPPGDDRQRDRRLRGPAGRAPGAECLAPVPAAAGDARRPRTGEREPGTGGRSRRRRGRKPECVVAGRERGRPEPLGPPRRQAGACAGHGRRLRRDLHRGALGAAAARGCGTDRGGERRPCRNAGQPAGRSGAAAVLVGH